MFITSRAIHAAAMSDASTCTTMSSNGTNTRPSTFLSTNPSASRRCIVPQRLIEYAFGERHARVEFDETADGVRVRVEFEPETPYPVEYQQAGWQAILDNFARHVAARDPQP